MAPSPSGERLQKILSAAGIASRRAAEVLITNGRVSVNGTTVVELGTRADPDRDDIRVDGQRVRVARRHRYILLNKPRGYVTTRKDPEHRPTVLDLVPEVHEYIYPVGRLDYDSEGLLLLTNDGELAQRLLHPKHEVEREYHARVRGVPDESDLERLRRGVTIEGRRTAPASVRLVDVGLGAREDQSLVSIALHEGRTRQVRDMCDVIGHPIVRLRRVRFGPISDRALQVGEHRDLTGHEIAALKHAAGGTAHGSPAAVRGATDEPRARRHRSGRRPAPDSGSSTSPGSRPGPGSRRR